MSSEKNWIENLNTTLSRYKEMQMHFEVLNEDNVISKSMSLHMENMAT